MRASKRSLQETRLGQGTAVRSNAFVVEDLLAGVGRWAGCATINVSALQDFHHFHALLLWHITLVSKHWRCHNLSPTPIAPSPLTPVPLTHWEPRPFLSSPSPAPCSAAVPHATAGRTITAEAAVQQDLRSADAHRPHAGVQRQGTAHRGGCSGIRCCTKQKHDHLHMNCMVGRRVTCMSVHIHPCDSVGGRG